MEVMVHQTLYHKDKDETKEEKNQAWVVYIENYYLDFFLLLKQFRWRKKERDEKKKRRRAFHTLGAQPDA